MAQTVRALFALRLCLSLLRVGLFPQATLETVPYAPAADIL